jgi:phytoene dehydrogenase-like protein
VEGGLVVDDAPAIIEFPAPWRDLFRKSGRPMEAELARMGYALVPGEPPTVTFADGTELIMPTDRGGQYSSLADAYGPPVAERWQQLLDRLGEVWQTLRGLGVEAELRGRRQLNRTTRASLFGRRSTLAEWPTRLSISIWQPSSAALPTVPARCPSSPRLRSGRALHHAYLRPLAAAITQR